MLNEYNCQGRFTADPELRTTPSGVHTTTFNLAVDRNYKAEGSEYETDFITFVAWRKTAEFICQYFKKGNPIIINAMLRSRSFERDGIKRYVTEAYVNRVFFSYGAKRDGSEENIPDIPEYTTDDIEEVVDFPL